ncbi:MAG: hypothetical protein NUW37_09790 [Planctomycetes bacterium]|nr:hypothetical protein [Planctomycetota bacterium]
MKIRKAKNKILVNPGWAKLDVVHSVKIPAKRRIAPHSIEEVLVRMRRLGDFLDLTAGKGRR